jgi:hypothetical protein
MVSGVLVTLISIQGTLFVTFTCTGVLFPEKASLTVNMHTCCAGTFIEGAGENDGSNDGFTDGV